MKTKTKHSVKRDNVLTGLSFLSLEDGKPQWQGFIIGKVTEDTFLVWFYSWLTGGQTDGKIIPVTEMSNWIFFNCDEDLREYCKKFQQ